MWCGIILIGGRINKLKIGILNSRATTHINVRTHTHKSNLKATNRDKTTS